MIKNEYTIIEDTVTFHITRRNGDLFDVLIDLDNLDKIDKINRKIHVSWHSDIQNYYAEICEYLGMVNGKPKYKTLLLHRIITDQCDTKNRVDHKEQDKTLDNRRCNLRVTTHSKNTKSRRGINKNNKSGYRNVSWCNARRKWVVQLQINNKNKVLGTFPYEKLEEAGKFAEEMRKLYYGEFAGKG